MLAVLVAWLVITVAFPPRGAQDAIPLIVAGEMVDEEPEAIYVSGETGGIFELEPAFLERSCEIMEEGELDCERYAVAFLSLPGALPILAALAVLGPDLGIMVIRLLAYACLAAGVLVLWGRLSRLGEKATSTFALCVLLLTPLALIPIDLGQTSTFMFLSAVLGTATAAAGRPAALRGLVWAGTALMKASPLVIGAVLVLQRRWQVLAWGVGALAVTHLGAAALGGPELFGWFLESVDAVSGGTAINPYNGAFDAALHQAPGVSMSVATAEQAGWVLRVVAAGAAAAGFFKLRDRDVQWAFAWAVLIVLLPLTWWHYSIVSFGALAVAVSRSPRAERLLWVLPAFLVIGLPMSIANNRGWSMPTAQALLASAGAVAVYLIGREAVPAQGESSDADGVGCDEMA